MKQYLAQNICLTCLGCCRFGNIRSKWSPCLLKQEIKILRKNKIKFFLRPKTQKLKLAPCKEQFFCPFFNVEKNSCKIYKARPFDCRLYPFMLTRSKNQVYLMVDANCPYVEKTIKSDKFNKYADYLSDFLSQPKIKKTILENRSIIGYFPEKTVIRIARLFDLSR